MGSWLDFSIISKNLTYFFIGSYPHGHLGGVALTLILAVSSCVLSFFGGLILGLLSISHIRAIRYPTIAIINAIRGVPLLMVIFFMYFLLPGVLGHSVPEVNTVIAALTFFTSAYMAQIVRAGIESIPKGQMEAAISTGLHPWQAMFYIILPQGLRNMVPSFVNQFVSLIKDTSLAFIVGVSELTHVATQINNRSMIYPAEIFLFISVIYFVICYAFTSLSRWLERRLSWHKSIG
ncbi:amino acid ABC transporter permease [Desulforhabdus amnigena]|jgi:polar amino acid transport system permease protein|uniref:Glutamate/aspartate import permease protein GltK n=1 Tax=Desulforhabdus amnigena TaxID=40218 RepID=A0A9W6FT95_9BACT|nr:amino acid ABC transporter permease [Desulforhabdus amnigena]NLJ26674.1 amino acid ABC transporter permease [Deltaproteobacteria bacterium]GLI33320.1 amino acid ABC transporter permease [Desulforhabdus amnigena]